MKHRYIYSNKVWHNASIVIDCDHGCVDGDAMGMVNQAMVIMKGLAVGCQ